MPVSKVWSDLDLSFLALENTGALSMKKGPDAVVRSVKYLLMTNFYERPFRPELGCRLTSRLFDPMSYLTTLRIKEDIEETINNFEPRVQLNEVVVEAREKENGYMISLKFFIVNEEVERTSTFFLERGR